jgi:hypothetical protein
LSMASDQGCAALLSLGSKGLTLAANAVMTVICSEIHIRFRILRNVVYSIGTNVPVYYGSIHKYVHTQYAYMFEWQSLLPGISE